MTQPINQSPVSVKAGPPRGQPMVTELPIPYSKFPISHNVTEGFNGYSKVLDIGVFNTQIGSQLTGHNIVHNVRPGDCFSVWGFENPMDGQKWHYALDIQGVIQ